MVEPCESGQCDLNSRSFKAYLARFMAATIPLAPFTNKTLWYRIQQSSKAAAQQCNGPDNACGLRWTEHAKYDGSTGIGEQMAALEIFKANLVQTTKAPVTGQTGGTSKGNSGRGKGTGSTSGSEEKENVRTREITMADKAGAGMLAALGVLMPVCGAVFLVIWS
jgi:mannan endo-1,6-alpha-mannosidase